MAKKADKLGANMGPKYALTVAYQKRLDELVKRMVKASAGLANVPSARLKAELAALRLDWQKKAGKVAPGVAGWVTAQTDKAATAGVKKVLSDYGLKPVKPDVSPNVKAVTKSIIKENVALIKTVPTKYFGGIQKAIEDQLDDGAMNQKAVYDVVMKAIGDKGPQAERRAKIIARDQTSKASGKLTRARSLEVGITKGVWIHSNAGREPRPGHLDAGKKKRVFDLEKGLLVDNASKGAKKKDVRHTWPGHEINCRCTYRPVIDELEEVEEEKTKPKKVPVTKYAAAPKPTKAKPTKAKTTKAKGKAATYEGMKAASAPVPTPAPEVVEVTSSTATQWGPYPRKEITKRSYAKDWSDTAKKIADDLSTTVPPVLEEQEYRSIRTYSGGDYSAINGYLRGDKRRRRSLLARDIKKHTEALDTAIKKTVPLPQELTVKRSFGSFTPKVLALRDEDTLHDSGFVSTSINRGIGSQSFDIILPKGTKGIFFPAVDNGTSHVTHHPTEAEFLLPRNAMFKVVKRDDMGRPTTLLFTGTKETKK